MFITRVAREAAAAATAAESELVDQVDHCQKDDLSSSAVKMRDFTPMGYRSFLKRLPPPKRQKNNAYLDENFDVTIGATKESHSERYVFCVSFETTPLRCQSIFNFFFD